MSDIKVNIITGFLGSGKTTAISNMLKNKPLSERWAIIINEFGKIAIDSVVLKEQSDGTDEIVEVAGGCICCSSRDMFEENLQQIVEKQKLDRIIIEPTGLGGLQSVKGIIQNYQGLTLKPIICLVDIGSINNPRLKINPIFNSQINDSNVVFVSKCDVQKSKEQSDEVIAWIKDNYSHKELYGKVSEGILSLEMLDLEYGSLSDKVSSSSYIHSPDSEILQTEQIYLPTAIFDMQKLKEQLLSNPDLERAKGIVNTLQGWVSFNYTSDSFTYDEVLPKESGVIVLFLYSSYDSHKELIQSLSNSIVQGRFSFQI